MKKLKTLLFILPVLTLLNCTGQNKPKEHSIKESNRSKNTFESCFAGMDTSKAGNGISCSGGTYKLVNERCVIRINPDFPVQFDSCYTINIDEFNGKRLAELFVFDNKDASLANICTDLIIANSPEPSRHLSAKSGQLIIGFSDPVLLYGNKTYHTTILIKNLIFTDSEKGEKIELKNELIWKVLNIGTPG